MGVYFLLLKKLNKGKTKKTTPSPPCPAGWADTHLAAYLGVHGPVEDLAVTDPDDGGGRLCVVGMAGEVEGVSSPEADHRASADDWVLRGNWRSRRRRTGGQPVDDTKAVLDFFFFLSAWSNRKRL